MWACSKGEWCTQTEGTGSIGNSVLIAVPMLGGCGKISPERTDKEEKYTGHLGWKQREAGSRNGSFQWTSLALFPPHKSSLQSETNLTRYSHFFSTVVKILLQDFIKADPKVLLRPGEGVVEDQRKTKQYFREVEFAQFYYASGLSGIIPQVWAK